MKSPAFQFYAAEFLADENVVLMSNQEVGCYIKLMAYCWREGSIPGDIGKLAKLCNEDSSAMAQLWLSISQCFAVAIDEPSRMVHPRLEKERIKQKDHREERSRSGKKGAQKRWENREEKGENQEKPNNRKKRDGSAIAKPMAEHIANDSSSSSSSSSTELKEQQQQYAHEPKLDDEPPKRPPPPMRHDETTPFAMSCDWQPNECFDGVLLRAGMRFDSETLAMLVVEFVSYWDKRGDKKTQASWEHAFLQQCIRWKTKVPTVMAARQKKPPVNSALHSFDNVDYQYGVRADGSF